MGAEGRGPEGVGVLRPEGTALRGTRPGVGNLTEGPILPALFKLSWPIMVANLLQTAYNLIDTIWVGRLGPEAVAALSLGFPVIFFLMSVGMGFTIAGTALVAQYTGAGSQEGVSRVAGQTMSFVFVVAVVFAAVGFVATDSILTLLGAEPEVLPLASAYLRILFGGVPFMFLFFLFQALLKGWGDTFTPMIIMVASTLLNIVLDPFLIFGWAGLPALGVAGAAWATVIARGLAAVAAAYLLLKDRVGIKLRVRHLVPDLPLIRKLIVIGLPSAAEQSLVSLGMAFMTGTVAAFGTMSLAAYGIGNRVVSVVAMPAMGLAGACTTMVGQNLGAGKPERAQWTAWLTTGIAFGLLTVVAVLVYLFPGPLVAIFNDHPDVLAGGSSYLAIISLSFPFFAARFILNGAARGAGRTLPAMLNSLLSLWLLRVPLANLLAHGAGLGTDGIWLGMSLANVGGALAAAAYLIWGNWRTSVIESQLEPDETAVGAAAGTAPGGR